MLKVLKEIILSLRNKHLSEYKYDFQKRLLSGALLPTGNIPESALSLAHSTLKASPWQQLHRQP